MIDRTVSVIVPYTASIHDVKHEIFAKDGMKVSKQAVYWKSKELPCETKLKGVYFRQKKR